MKKLIVFGLCIVGLVLPSGAQVVLEGSALIENVILVDLTANPFQLWEYRPVDPTTSTHFKSPVLISFEVPPSPRSSTMFFECWGQFLYTWTSDQIRRRALSMGFSFTSPAVPNVVIFQGYGVPQGVNETNYAGDTTYPEDETGRVKGYCKLIMSRQSGGIWSVWDDGAGRFLTGDEAISAISKFIDNGFNVEMYAEGDVQGLSYIAPVYWQVQISRLVGRR